jgi:hypothetical protein
VAFDLGSIQRGKTSEAPRVVVFGAHGLGKSTFAAGAPSPIFIQTEDGLGNIETNKFPMATSYDEVLEAMGTLYQEAHDFRTVVIDSLDWLEALVWKYVASKHGQKDIEAFGYGKGFVYAADEFRQLLQGLDALRKERGMAVVMTAHCEVKRVDDPTTEPYDRWQIKLNKHASAVVQEWADIIGFVAEPVIIAKEDVGFQKKVRRGVGRGTRLLHVSPSPAYTAKNRYGLPATLPLSWEALSEALSDNQEQQ